MMEGNQLAENTSVAHYSCARGRAPPIMPLTKQTLITYSDRSNPRLATHRDGWLDGKGIAINQAQGDQLTDWFAQHFSDEVPPPRLYPTPEGGVLAEWTIGDWETSVEFEFEPFSAELHDYNLVSEELRADSFALEHGEESRRLLDMLDERLG